MPLLDTRKQVAAKLEDVTGVAEALVGTDVDILPIEAQMTPDFDSFDREFVRSTLTRLLGITTEELGAFTLNTEMRGTQLGTFAAGAPSWFKFARACGMEQASITLLNLTSPTAGSITNGPFRHGETVIAASGGTGKVVHDWHNGATAIYIRDDDGGAFTAATTITGQATGAQAVLAGTPTVDNYGYSLFPVDDPVKTIITTGSLTTGTAVAGDVIQGMTSGALAVFISHAANLLTFRPLEGAWGANEDIHKRTALGTTVDTGLNTAVTDAGETYVKGHSMTIRLLEDGYFSEIAGARGNMRLVMPQINRPGRVEFAFAGFWNDHGDQVLFTGTSENTKQPPLFRNTAVYLGDNLTAGLGDQADEYNPCLASLELDLGNQLVNRECQSALKGIQEVVISDRQGAGRFNPELTLAAVYDWITLFQNGTPVRLRTQIGTANGNKFYITAPGLQYESAAPGQRNKITQRDMGFKLTGGNINNLTTTQTELSTIGGVNELVITYITGG